MPDSHDVCVWQFKDNFIESHYSFFMFLLSFSHGAQIQQSRIMAQTLTYWLQMSQWSKIKTLLSRCMHSSDARAAAVTRTSLPSSLSHFSLSKHTSTPPFFSPRKPLPFFLSYGNHTGSCLVFWQSAAMLFLKTPSNTHLFPYYPGSCHKPLLFLSWPLSNG